MGEAISYPPVIASCEPPSSLTEVQSSKLLSLLDEICLRNPFYQRKLRDIDLSGPASSVLKRLPFTTRSELEADQIAHPPFGTNLTYPLEHYCRFHQTSGTNGQPMRWLDTKESWAWFGRCWGEIFDAAGITKDDRLFFPFSFGPFVGFWAAFESAAERGLLCIPAGGMSTSSRLRMILDNAVTVVFCTPTYALRMAESARESGIDLAASPVRILIVAGEAGGSIPGTRQRIEAAWGARVFDHSGMTEIGAATFECSENPGTGVHVIESEFICESIDPSSGAPVEDGEIGELVLTNLGRVGSPLLRYRTGDRVRLTRRPCPCGRSYARLEGGILGRSDDMFIVRGNNVFPTAVESVLRSIAEVAEFRMTVGENGSLSQVKVEVEPAAGSDEPALAERVARALQMALSFRAEVILVPQGALPRFDMKAHRFVRAGCPAS
jgi:phenylacetate-CoA ligase